MIAGWRGRPTPLAIAERTYGQDDWRALTDEELALGVVADERGRQGAPLTDQGLRLTITRRGTIKPRMVDLVHVVLRCSASGWCISEAACGAADVAVNQANRVRGRSHFLGHVIASRVTVKATCPSFDHDKACHAESPLVVRVRGESKYAVEVLHRPSKAPWLAVEAAAGSAVGASRGYVMACSRTFANAASFFAVQRYNIQQNANVCAYSAEYTVEYSVHIQV